MRSTPLVLRRPSTLVHLFSRNAVLVLPIPPPPEAPVRQMNLEPSTTPSKAGQGSADV